MSHLRSHHSLSDILYFLKAFLTDATRCFGEKGFRTPDMIMCDGLVVLMQAIGLSFAKKKTPFGHTEPLLYDCYWQSKEER